MSGSSNNLLAGIVPRSSAAMSNKKRLSKLSKKKDPSENAPIFLRKTFAMINQCDPTIATWSEDGETFVVKDTEKFALEVIPLFFKHNNFSSFVRQLNFYGFRKIKTDSLRIREPDMETKYWRFRHEKFQRGRPDLLTEIRKSNHQEVPDKQEVDALKSEVKELRLRLNKANSDISQLRTLVEEMLKNSQVQEKLVYPASEPAPKKRKYDPMPASVPSSPLDEMVPLHVTSAIPDVVNNVSSDLDVPIQEDALIPSFPGIIPPPLKKAPRSDTFGSISSTDEDILATLFDDEFTKIVLPDVTTSLEPALDSVKSNTEPSSSLVQKLRDSLANLPPNMQELFVERLVATISDPVSFQRQVEAVTALIEAAANDSRMQQDSAVAASNAQLPSQDLTLATAVLGAFLARYEAQANRNDLLDRP